MTGRRLLVLLILCISGTFFVSNLFSQKTPGDHVNPFIGTDEMGHTFPGATVPFGTVQLSPDTSAVNFLKNGKPFSRGYITHQEILDGGTLVFVMSAVPNKKWATSSTSMPFSMSKK